MSNIPITTLGSVFGFNDTSAMALLKDHYFRKAFWGLVDAKWETKLIKTKSDYLLVQRYNILCYGETLTLIVSRPVSNPECIDGIMSIRVDRESIRCFFVDGHICKAVKVGASHYPMDDGVYWGNSDIGTCEYGLEELKDGRYILRSVVV